ncbi:MAG: hypothetical protein IJX99_04740 [Clostridia bacterium]|nr:hypothetical protein [Clostridia bacterium]
MKKIQVGIGMDNVKVFQRVDTDAEHIHCSREALADAISRITVGAAPFSRHTISLDHVVGHDRCVKVAPEDKIVMWQRPGRSGKTPMFASAKSQVETKDVNVVLCFDNEELCEYVVITAFTGVDAPQEPWDPRVRNLEFSTKFWAEHALVPTEEEISLMKAEGIL